MKNKKTCAVVIPVYKEYIDKYEEISFRQCMKILCRYDIFLITHESLNTSVYDQIAKIYGIETKKIFYAKDFFLGIDGYNKLLKSKMFYSSFLMYNYILIYQLDAFVFRDDLEYWCKQGYDYIGAPWIYTWRGADNANELYGVGNGGFSLRKISFFLKVLSWRLPLQRWQWISSLNTIGILKKILYFMGWRNNIGYFIKTETQMNEDIFFTSFLGDSYLPPKLPSFDIAIHFAFEKYPSFLFAENGGQLPFGCHAFMKYEYEQFWKPIIEEKCNAWSFGDDMSTDNYV